MIACGPCSAMTAVKRAWISSSAADHEIGSNRPSPLAPTRRSGVVRRPGPWTNSGYIAGTLAQSTPAVYGFACEPRIFTIRSASTVTVRLQVSGQSRGQTLGRSTVAGVMAQEYTAPRPTLPGDLADHGKVHVDVPRQRQGFASRFDLGVRSLALERHAPATYRHVRELLSKILGLPGDGSGNGRARHHVAQIHLRDAIVAVEEEDHGGIVATAHVRRRGEHQLDAVGIPRDEPVDARGHGAPGSNARGARRERLRVLHDELERAIGTSGSARRATRTDESDHAHHARRGEHGPAPGQHDRR